MSAAAHKQNAQHPTVFQAIGSYADRFKDANGSPPKASTPITPTSGSNPIEPPAQAISSADPTVVMTKARDAKPAAVAQKAEEEDGPWQTVQSTRQRQTKEEKRGSNSKNWRDRSEREGPKEKQAVDNERRGDGQGKNKKKGTGNTSSASTAAPAIKPAAPRQAAPIPASSKPAWGIAPTAGQRSQSASSAPTPTVPSVLSDEAQQSQTVPSSPSLNGTTLTTTSTSVTVGSPNLSADTSLTAPSVLSKNPEVEEESSWRARPKPKAEDVEPPIPAAPPKAAPPPAVNAWDLRKKQMGPSSTTKPTAEAKPAAQPLHNGSVARSEPAKKAIPNGATPASSTKQAPKKKAFAQMAAPPPPSRNAELWPDVNQAAEVVKTDEQKGKVKDRRDSENASVVDETAGTGKKPKWTAIPAAELQAAVDEATERSRRQNRMEANAKKRSTSVKGEGESSTAGKGGKAKKPVVNGEGRRGPRADRAGSVGEIRLPPHPPTQGGPQSGFKPVFGTVQDEEAKLAPSVNGDLTGAADKIGAPISRQTSRQSHTKRSPAKPHTQLPSPSPAEQAELSPSGPLSRPLAGSTTAPLPQHSFNPAANPNLPRARGRNDRGSFNGRGRGGFRSASAFPYKGHGYTSPPMVPTGLPVDGTPYANGNGYQRGFGLGFQPFYPSQHQAGIYDPAQAQYGNMGMYRGAMPPPPMPQTVIPNIDPLRFYVLGQVEYYFSMQNLAMDFFLRQQMDSEGWIDIAMISSFKRIKSLTPEVSIVRECMELSSILEVREDRVRLSGGENQRWVLPGARASIFNQANGTTNPTSPLSNASEIRERERDVKDVSSHGIPASMDVSAFTNANNLSEGMENGNGTGKDEITSPQFAQIQPLQTPPSHRALLSEVENALMKNSATATAATGIAVSASVSVPSSSNSVAEQEKDKESGDGETVTNTPATSMSGDGKEAEVELQ